VVTIHIVSRRFTLDARHADHQRILGIHKLRLDFQKLVLDFVDDEHRVFDQVRGRAVSPFAPYLQFEHQTPGHDSVPLDVDLTQRKRWHIVESIGHVEFVQACIYHLACPVSTLLSRLKNALDVYACRDFVQV